jgi:hypothetical protein
MSEYFHKFILNNKEYILLKIELIGSILYTCLEKNITGTYNLSKYNIEGKWKLVPPGGLIKEWLFYTCLEFIGNSDTENIIQLTNNYDKLIPLPYQMIDNIIVK